MHMYDKCFQRASLMIFRTLYFSMIPLTIFHALHTQYIFRTDPLSSGGCVSCPQVQTLVSEIRQPRISTQLFQSAPLFRSIVRGITFWYVYMLLFRVRRGPVPSYDVVVTLRGLRSHVWVRVGLLFCCCVMTYVWGVPIRSGSLVGLRRHICLSWQLCMKVAFSAYVLLGSSLYIYTWQPCRLLRHIDY